MIQTKTENGIIRKALKPLLTLIFATSLSIPNDTPLRNIDAITDCQKLSQKVLFAAHNNQIKTVSISANINGQTCEIQSPDISNQTRLQTASCVKPLAATTILHTLESHSDRFTENQKRSIKLLLSHNAGVAPFTKNIPESFQTKALANKASRAELISRYAPQINPKQPPQYSNLGYIFAANLLERNLPLSFESYLDQTLNTAGLSDYQSGKRHMLYHKNIKGKKLKDDIPIKLPESLSAAGNFFASSKTLRKFADIHYKCLSESGECPLNIDPKEIHTPTSSGYGLGWKIQKIGSNLVSQHLGQLDSSRCAIALSHKELKTIAIIIAEGDPNAINFIRTLTYQYF
ncbi:serine hydrolase [Microbulbifer sp. PSTR4-B]|uniref:serine hydrolase n=1 Tax=Microbulbifer sp. PSTR4-B TaxID=3243396 RepID=UPI004038FCFA